jgi:hypothetical protein
MYIHFIYVENKEFKQNYITTIKTENEILDIKNVNELLYINLYLNNKPENFNNNNINFYSIFYIKKGLIINNNIDIVWNKLLILYLKNINLINLIDSNYINDLKNRNILLFNIEIYKNDLYPMIIDLQIK